MSNNSFVTYLVRCLESDDENYFNTGLLYLNPSFKNVNLHYHLYNAIHNNKTKAINILLNHMNVPSHDMTLEQRVAYYQLFGDADHG